MSYTDGIISMNGTDSVSIADIQTALSSGLTDLGTLCQSTNIKDWAKYKPVCSTKLSELTDTDRANVNWGMTNIYEYSTLAAMLTAVKNGDNATAWTYVRPSGGISGSSAEPFRMLDFRKYSTYGERPIGQATQTAWVKPAVSTQSLWIAFSQAPDDGYNLTLKDFSNNQLDLSDYYVCLCLYNDSTQLYVTRCGTSDDTSTAIKVSELGSYNPSFGSKQYANGTWNAFVFLSSRAIATGTGDSTSGSYIPIAYCNRDEFTFSQITITTATLGVSILSFSVDRNNITTLSNANLYVAYSIQNTDATPYTIVGGIVYVDFMNSAGDVVDTLNVSTTSIAASTTITHARAVHQLPTGVKARNVTSAKLRFTIGTTVISQTVAVTDAPPQSA